MSTVVLPEKCVRCGAEIPRRLVTMETLAAFVMEVVWCPECGLEQPKDAPPQEEGTTPDEG